MGLTRLREGRAGFSLEATFGGLCRPGLVEPFGTVGVSPVTNRATLGASTLAVLATQSEVFRHRRNPYVSRHARVFDTNRALTRP